MTTTTACPLYAARASAASGADRRRSYLAGDASLARAAPVCRQPARPGRGWVIRHAGRWVRLRCGDCAATFERDPARYAAGPPRV